MIIFNGKYLLIYWKPLNVKTLSFIHHKLGILALPVIFISSSLSLSLCLTLSFSFFLFLSLFLSFSLSLSLCLSLFLSHSHSLFLSFTLSLSFSLSVCLFLIIFLNSVSFFLSASLKSSKFCNKMLAAAVPSLRTTHL